MSDNKKEEEKPKQQEKKEEQQNVTALIELKNQLRQLAKGIQGNDTKVIQKVTKNVRRFKKLLQAHHLETVWKVFYPGNSIAFAQFPGYNNSYKEEFDISAKNVQNMQKVPEINFYLEVLLMIYFFYQRDSIKDQGQKQQFLTQAIQLSQKLLNDAEQINKRSQDYITAIVYFYFSRGKELNGQLLEIRERLFVLYRTSCLQSNDIGQATLLNLLLRNYLAYNHYEQAHHLVQKSGFPEQASNNEYCRYLYYTGRIKAVQLEYSEALSRLNQSIRKAPDTTALGFRIEAQKLAIIVELLQGDIPDRSIFTQPEFQKPLFHYYKLVQCILKGSVLDYSAIVSKYASQFINDKLYTLIKRLHQMVIKTGLRKINLSYSKISFADVAQKLKLGKGQNVEFIIAKAIRDGILQATIDHQNQFITIKEKREFYNTNEPQIQFQKRIDYCVNIYNQSTKALQYPNIGYKQDKKQQEEIDEMGSDIYSDLFDF